MPQLAAFLEAIPQPALLVRSDHRIEAANDGARSLFGQGIVERHFITALRQPNLLDAVEHCLRDGISRQIEYQTSTDQHDIPYRATIRAVPIQGQPAVLVTLNDVSDVFHATQMRRDFVANVSHELRTPLTALIGFIETLRGPARDDPAGRDRFLSIMDQEANRMNRLVDDLLSLSRVEEDERVRPTDQVALQPVILSTVHGLAPLAAQADVTLIPDLPEQSVTVPGDADQLRQVLTNLVVNGIKYGGAGNTVTIRLTPPEPVRALRGDGVQISVVDTGPGVDPLDLPRLTERFYRVDDHRSREMGGTGLGLAIVKHIVNRHRGRVLIDSAPGEGLAVTILLPLA